MKKLIVERIGIIKEEDYQKIKKEMNKKDDCFYEHELKHFNAIFNATPRIFTNNCK